MCVDSRFTRFSFRRPRLIIADDRTERFFNIYAPPNVLDRHTYTTGLRRVNSTSSHTLTHLSVRYECRGGRRLRNLQCVLYIVTILRRTNRFVRSQKFFFFFFLRCFFGQFFFESCYGSKKKKQSHLARLFHKSILCQSIEKYSANQSIRNALYSDLGQYSEYSFRNTFPILDFKSVQYCLMIALKKYFISEKKKKLLF